jgi:hypothetical protein
MKKYILISIISSVFLILAVAAIIMLDNKVTTEKTPFSDVINDNTQIYTNGLLPLPKNEDVFLKPLPPSVGNTPLPTPMPNFKTKQNVTDNTSFNTI